jgi:hypothetical protein
MSIYLKKTNFQNKSVTALVGNLIKNKDLLPPKDRQHLESRSNFKQNADGVIEYTGELQKEKFAEIARRLDRALKLHGARVNMFTQYSLKPDIENFIISELPKALSELNPKIAVQVIRGGNACSPHKDHSKKCSMFYLYTEPDVKTIWWEKNGDFEEFEDFRYADPDKLKIVHDEIIKPGQWYVFNNDSYHSIHLLEDKTINRITLLIEFEITAEELYELINNE